MPPPHVLLDGLTAIANDWRWLAVAWHVLAGSVAVPLAAGWRPSARAAGRALVLPIASVGVVAAVAGNPVNAVMFTTLAVVLLAAARRLAETPIRWAPAPAAALGLGAIAFGLGYPHFVRVDSWTEYVYASPFGLVPCPTLAAVLGASLMVATFGSTLWHVALVAAGLAYGAIGVLWLGVGLDAGLVAAALSLGLAASGRARTRR
jgi:hypothetical protein